MNKKTIILNETILRAVKGIVKAWERWIREQKEGLENE